MSEHIPSHPSRAKQRSLQEVHALLKEFEHSEGLTIKDFCELHDVSEGTFYNWRRKYQNRDTKVGNGPSKRFIPLDLGSLLSKTELPALFAEVTKDSYRIYQPVSPEFLKSLAQ
jgi:transposase-like protein